MKSSRGQQQQDVDQLEEAEQSLIEHIRTAGIKKTREYQLIDEIISLRKRRRQVFSLIIKDNENNSVLYKEEKEKLKDQLNRLKQRIIDVNNELEKKDMIIKNIQKEFKMKLEDVHLKYRDMVKQEVKRVRESYDKKLITLEEKIEKIQEKSTRSDEVNEEEQMRKIQLVLDENNQRQQEKYSTSMQRFVILLVILRVMIVVYDMLSLNVSIYDVSARLHHAAHHFDPHYVTNFI